MDIRYDRLNFAMLAVSFPEWLNWIERGRIRCNDRITFLNGEDDRMGFDCLMDRAPDVSLDDDQAFVLAKLKQDYWRFIKPYPASNTPVLIWLGIDAVSEFYPLSDRGRRLIEADASRAGALLGQPVFEALWKGWRDHQLSTFADLRGRTLVDAMGLETPELVNCHEKFLPFLLYNKQFPSAEKSERIIGTRAYPWAVAIAIFGEVTSVEEKEKQDAELGLKKVIKRLAKDYEINQPISVDSDMLRIAEVLDKGAEEACGKPISFFEVALSVHYTALLRSERDINLASLVEDLKQLYQAKGPSAAATASYLVGRQMSDVAVTSLAYAKMADDFPCLERRSLPCALEVAFQLAKEEIPRQADESDTSGVVDTLVSEDNSKADAGEPGEDVVADGGSSSDADASDDRDSKSEEAEADEKGPDSQHPSGNTAVNEGQDDATEVGTDLSGADGDEAADSTVASAKAVASGDLFPGDNPQSDQELQSTVPETQTDKTTRASDSNGNLLVPSTTTGEADGIGSAALTGSDPNQGAASEPKTDTPDEAAEVSNPVDNNNDQYVSDDESGVHPETVK